MEQRRHPRVSDIVAERLRSDILSGRYREGDVLNVAHVADGVFDDFTVSLPAAREAVRGLENDGLLRTRRGSAGGVVVQLPTTQRIGEVIAMILQARGVAPDDVARTLARIEPVCASMCAERDDRATTVVPALAAVLDDQRSASPDEFMRSARAFHDTIVQECGSTTMVVAVGALEVIWSVHASTIYVPTPKYSDDIRDAAIAEHERVLAAIEAGDSVAAASELRNHIEVSGAFPPTGEVPVVDASLVFGRASQLGWPLDQNGSARGE